MTKFQPYPGMQLRISQSKTRYEFLSYQYLPDDEPGVCMIEGQEGFIYALRNPDDETFWTLKVFKPAYRDAHIAYVTEALLRYKSIAGFYLGHRICFTRAQYASLLDEYPELEYAVIMPWLAWKTWLGLLRSPQLSASYTRIQAMKLALASAKVLEVLERNGLAHTDLAGGNIMYTADFTRMELLDIEGLYLPDIAAPKRLSYGSPGYQHRRLGRNGQYTAPGDRFAGAILLTEMLTWWNPLIRAQTAQNAMSLFAPEELQKTTNTLWLTVRDVLWSLNPELLSLFDQAWASANLSQCPPLSAWLTVIENSRIP